jgi:hypothetical protein
MDLRVFISYSTADAHFVDQLTADLISEHLRVWVDRRESVPGDSFPQRIAEGLISADVFLIVLSPASVNSGWVQRELNSALVRETDDKKLRIVPILLKDCTIPILVRAKHYADFRTSYSSGLLQLLDALREWYEQRRAESVVACSESSETKQFAELSRLCTPENAFDGITPTRSQEGIISLAPAGIPTVVVKVLFKSTGESYLVRLPLDLRCEIAARRIIGELFLEDLPPHRRDAYLTRGDYYLSKANEPAGTTTGSKTTFRMSYTTAPGFWSETLREAGIKDGDELLVLASTPCPWAHCVQMATVLIEMRERSLATDPSYRLFDYAIGLVRERLAPRQLYIPPA